jgi:hypothetical protein
MAWDRLMNEDVVAACRASERPAGSLESTNQLAALHGGYSAYQVYSSNTIPTFNRVPSCIWPAVRGNPRLGGSVPSLATL